jgi:hypothetical protein
MRSSDTSYQQVLIELVSTGATFKTFGSFDYCRSNDFIFDIPKEQREGTKTILLRHDIDHSTSWAHDMAQVEFEMGVTSTYFFLTTDIQREHWSNVDTRERNIELLLKMQNMGHEIGLHYDVLGEYFMHGVPPEESIQETLDILRTAGLLIHGCVAHGSAQVRHMVGAIKKALPIEYINYVSWKEIKPCRRELSLNGHALSLPALDLSSFGLRYEAYFTRMTNYVSDNHGRLWSGGRVVDPSRTTLRGRPCTRGEDLRHSPMLLDWEFESVNASGQAVVDCEDGGVIQVLTHPIHWHSCLI